MLRPPDLRWRDSRDSPTAGTRCACPRLQDLKARIIPVKVVKKHTSCLCAIEKYSHAIIILRREIDAVVVTASTKAHAPIVRDALEAGKHVLCEKPMCAEVKEGQELVALAESKGLILMVGHVFLFNPGIIKLKELLRWAEAHRAEIRIEADTDAAVQADGQLAGRTPVEVSVLPRRLRVVRAAVHTT